MPAPNAIMRGAYQLWYAPDLLHVHGRRERRTLMLGSLSMLLAGLGWGLYFSTLGNWPLVALDLVMVGSGLVSGVLVWHKRVQAAAVVMFATLFTVVCLIACLFDAASAQSPRTTHLYLLPLSVAALMTFRDGAAWLRHGMAAACMVAMGLLAVSNGSPIASYALPESVRAAGGWIQAIAALTLFYAMLHVMQNDVSMRSLLEDELSLALERQQFELHYQPQLDTQGRVIAAEALVRWRHPQRGLVLPGDFIEVAEQSGLILPLGLWVLQRACAQLRAWSAQPGYEQLRLAVNISQAQLRQKDFVAQVLGLMERYAIAPGLLELEITESMLVEDLADIILKMGALRGHGLTFSLDDFGTGYSALNHLKRLPLSQLKIDQSFVRDVLTDNSDASIARTVVALGHNLGLTVIAEGVESLAQHAFLVGCGCEYFQGFLFSQAMPVAAFNAFVQERAGP